RGEGAYLDRAVGVAVADRDFAARDRQFLVAELVEILAVLPRNGFGKFVDRIDAGGRVHPADVLVETLIDEELAPRRSAVGVQPFVAGNLRFAAEVEGDVRIDQQQRVAVRGELGRDRDAVGTGRLDPGRRLALRQRDRRGVVGAVEFREPGEINVLDVAADAALGEGKRHPWLVVFDDLRMHVCMSGEIPVHAVGPRAHQFLQPARAFRVILLQHRGVDEQLVAQVVPDRRFAFGLRAPAERGQVIHLDAVEVVFALRVDHPEYGIGIGLAVDVRNAPVVTRDDDGLRFALQPRVFDAGFRDGRLPCRRRIRTGTGLRRGAKWSDQQRSEQGGRATMWNPGETC